MSEEKMQIEKAVAAQEMAMRQKTTEELAVEAFEAGEKVRALERMNTPTDYEGRKAAFVEMALAREAECKARIALMSRTGGSPYASAGLGVLAGIGPYRG